MNFKSLADYAPYPLVTPVSNASVEKRCMWLLLKRNQNNRMHVSLLSSLIRIRSKLMLQQGEGLWVTCKYTQHTKRSIVSTLIPHSPFWITLIVTTRNKRIG